MKISTIREPSRGQKLITDNTVTVIETERLKRHQTAVLINIIYFFLTTQGKH